MESDRKDHKVAFDFKQDLIELRERLEKFSIKDFWARQLWHVFNEQVWFWFLTDATRQRVKTGSEQGSYANRHLPYRVMAGQS